MTIAADDFTFVRGFLRARAAIALDDGKEYLVESRLEPLARREGFADVGALVARLRLGGVEPLERSVVEALTTNETSFFRDWKPFEALRQAILPDAAERRAGDRRLDLWSAACSSGQEVYSLAMLVKEHLPQLATWDVHLHATDLSLEMVARTQAGRFSTLEVNRGLPAPLLARHFRRDGESWVVGEPLRRMVRATALNLIAPWSGLPLMDVVLMRNVLIYFDVPTRRSILEKVRRQLRPGGVLLLGTAETTIGLHDGFRREEAAGATYFRAT